MTKKNNGSAASAVKTIPEAVAAVIAQAEEISPSQLAHMKRVYVEAEQTRQTAKQAIAEQQACLGARNSFMVFLFAEYGLSQADTIDLETGKITRKA